MASVLALCCFSRAKCEEIRSYVEYVEKMVSHGLLNDV
jgi:hypothetical protein